MKSSHLFFFIVWDFWSESTLKEMQSFLSSSVSSSRALAWLVCLCRYSCFVVSTSMASSFGLNSACLLLCVCTLESVVHVVQNLHSSLVVFFLRPTSTSACSCSLIALLIPSVSMLPLQNVQGQRVLVFWIWSQCFSGLVWSHCVWLYKKINKKKYLSIPRPLVLFNIKLPIVVIFTCLLCWLSSDVLSWGSLLLQEEFPLFYSLAIHRKATKDHHTHLHHTMSVEEIALVE